MISRKTTFIANFIIGVFLLSLSSCKDKAQDNPEGVSKKLVLLKVDYLTHDFEGGQQLEVAPHNNLTDSLPLIVNYIHPMDFGNLSIYYQSTNSAGLVFDGSVIWMGTGTRTYPSIMFGPGEFPLLSVPLDNIDSTEFQLVHYDNGGQQIYYDSIWDGINNLEIVDYCRSQNNTKMGLFLYQPSVGTGDPSDWDWYILMEK